MTNYETVATLVALGMAVIAMITAGIAANSAHAAEKQAAHAETQANAAIAQARSAERQVDIMRESLTIGHIGDAIRVRRALFDCDEAFQRLQLAARSGDESQIDVASENLIRISNVIEDMPPVFSAEIRRRAFHFLGELRSAEQLISLRKFKTDLTKLREEGDGLLVAVHEAIMSQIEELGR